MVEPDNKKHHLQGLGWSVAKTTSLSYHGLRFTIMFQIHIHESIFLGCTPLTNHFFYTQIHHSSAKHLVQVQASLIARRSFATLSPWHLRGFARLALRSSPCYHVCFRSNRHKLGVYRIPHFRTPPHGRITCVLCVTLSLSLFFSVMAHMSTHM